MKMPKRDRALKFAPQNEEALSSIHDKLDALAKKSKSASDEKETDELDEWCHEFLTETTNRIPYETVSRFSRVLWALFLRWSAILSFQTTNMFTSYETLRSLFSADPSDVVWFCPTSNRCRLKSGRAFQGKLNKFFSNNIKESDFKKDLKYGWNPTIGYVSAGVGVFEVIHNDFNHGRLHIFEMVICPFLDFLQDVRLKAAVLNFRLIHNKANETPFWSSQVQ